MLPPKVLFFDVNETLLDLSPMRGPVAALLDNRPDLAKLWFSTLLHYSLVVTAGDRFRTFGELGKAAMEMVARANGLTLDVAGATKILNQIRSLPPHPEVPGALAQLKKAGYRMYTLTNGAQQAVDDQIRNAGLNEFFTERLSVETIGIYKPHQHVYRWAARYVGESVEDCMLIAAHGWDTAGAQWAGMRAVFVDRPGQVLYPLGPEPELVVADFVGVADYLV